MKATQDEINNIIFQRYVTDEWQAIKDMCASGGRYNTIRGALGYLLEQGLVDRRWAGNARFGRYLYRVAR